MAQPLGCPHTTASTVPVAPAPPPPCSEACHPLAPAVGCAAEPEVQQRRAYDGSPGNPLLRFSSDEEKATFEQYVVKVGLLGSPTRGGEGTQKV